MTGPWPGQMVSISCAAASACRRSSDSRYAPERAVRMGHHRGAAAEHGVAGEHGTLGGQHERQRVGGVAGRRDDVHLEPVDRHHVTGAEALRPESVRRVQGSYAAPDGLRELAGRLRVVEVVVGQQHHGHVPGRRAHRVQVRRRGRPGVDHHRPRPAGLAEHPRVGAVEGHRRGVVGQHAHRPRPEAAARPGHESRCSTSVRSRSGIDSDAESPDPSTSGMNISTGGRAAAAASTSRGEECRPTSRQVR